MGELKELPYAEYLARLRTERTEAGLYEAVKRRCDNINSECKDMGYVQHGYIQEQLCEILELVRMSEENEQDDGR